MAVRCLKLAGLYLLIGMTMGIVMGATERLSLAPAHAHINLLGWVTYAIAAVVFSVWPNIAATRPARIFFWLYSLSLPPTLVALTLFLLGYTAWLPVLMVAQLGVFAAAVSLVISFFVGTRVPGRVASAGGNQELAPRY